MKKINYQEGTLFAVPVETGKYAIGLVARFSPNYVVLGYFFPEVYADIPTLQQVGKLSPADAILVVRFGDYGLIKKLWPVIGTVSPWLREEWPTPRFFKQDPLLDIGWEVEYDDTVPTKFIRETKCDGNPQGLGSDGIYGYKAVEEELSEILLPE